MSVSQLVGLWLSGLGFGITVTNIIWVFLIRPETTKDRDSTDAG